MQIPKKWLKVEKYNPMKHYIIVVGQRDLDILDDWEEEFSIQSVSKFRYLYSLMHFLNPERSTKCSVHGHVLC